MSSSPLAVPRNPIRGLDFLASDNIPQDGTEPPADEDPPPCGHPGNEPGAGGESGGGDDTEHPGDEPGGEDNGGSTDHPGDSPSPPSSGECE